jgi:hypothetical protein
VRILFIMAGTACWQMLAGALSALKLSAEPAQQSPANSCFFNEARVYDFYNLIDCIQSVNYSVRLLLLL